MNTLTTEVIGAPAIKELESLLKHRRECAVQIGKLILKMVKSRPGGLDQKNVAVVFNYLRDKFNLPVSTLAQYLQIGQGLKLPEVFNMTTKAAALAWCLMREDQQRLVFHGVKVVEDLTAEPVLRRLHQLTDDQAIRLIDTRNCRLRDPKQQRAFMAAVPPGKRKRILELWKGKNSYVRVRVRAPIIDLKHLLKELDKYKLPSFSNPEIRAQLDADLEAEFGRPHGQSSA